MHVAICPTEALSPSTTSAGKDKKMKVELPNHLLHNPFHNRFNDPVSQRQDELQSEAYMVWLRERNLEHSGFKISSVTSSTTSHVRKVVSGVFALLLVVVVSMVFLVKVL